MSIQKRLADLEAQEKKDLGYKVVYRNPGANSTEKPTSQAEIDALKAEGYTVVIVEYAKRGGHPAGLQAIAGEITAKEQSEDTAQ